MDLFCSRGDYENSRMDRSRIISSFWDKTSVYVAEKRLQAAFEASDKQNNDKEEMTTLEAGWEKLKLVIEEIDDQEPWQNQKEELLNNQENKEEEVPKKKCLDNMILKVENIFKIKR
ncbi:hypothetical protein SESBI_20223 [Sesbania bispinosa]|nr:hypothetical protein SESBI_20223 [Sesbania bispinosa]